MDKERDFINFVRRGWIEVGGARMSLVDIKGGFYGMREVLAREVGDTADDLVCHAGIQGSTSFVSSSIETKELTPDENGFISAVETYSESGFGNFQIAELFWSKGWAIIRCADSFEGWAYAANNNLQSRSKCDYTRGVLQAFMRDTHRHAQTGIEELSVVETKCIGKGDKECEFLIGVPADIEACGYEIAEPKTSIKEKLERTVALLRESNLRLMRAEMQYRAVFDNIMNPIVIVDERLSVRNCNKPAEDFLCSRRSEMAGKNISEYLPAAHGVSLDEKIQEALKADNCIDFEIEVHTCRGKTEPCKIRICPIHAGLTIEFQKLSEAEG
ncbi:MAG: PAS domain-containing protein [Candidatus Abyssobacteria bacterium SURF_5]|uniref:PAS domain-containing protein n=1 Tax=Abyssobacteria bacterium (strain SURF_5) TaxID=2093360 RepID=A0A3A4NG76_ABYX5|nr:MAG: PAS domain-containing protein [Candidatus Abyssubacteria bacterium SURF_5]